MSSPVRPLRFIQHSTTPSPLGRKRQRLDYSSVPSTPSKSTQNTLPPVPFSPYRFTSDNEVVANIPPPSTQQSQSTATLPRTPAVQPTLPASSDPSTLAMQTALNDLEAESHLIRQQIAAEEQSDKETARNYARQVTNYQLWWDGNQAQLATKDPARVMIPAFPIIPAKVALFLQYETTRPQKRKRPDGTESTATLGVSGVKLAISALENWRLNNQHKYPDIPEAQRGLRTDIRIKQFESAASHKEPQRVQMAHALKAKGTNADTFTSDDLRRCSMWCITDFKGPQNIYIGLRDRAMLLTSCGVAFRGDNTRHLLISDLFTTDVVMNAKGLGETVPALTFIADNAKHNQTGRTDEFGAFRHRFVELCPVGAIALVLFAHFHVRNAPLPNFAPDFSDPQYGDYGRRDWYRMHLFPSAQDPMSDMSYDNHRKRVNLIYENNGVNISKVTHAGREYSVKTAREYGATVDGAKALGGWSESGSFRPCYDRALPLDALLGVAMFDAMRPETHFLAREFLEPPRELMLDIFPWIQDQLLALEEREKENPFARDIALRQFFKLLVWFRSVILQDAALIYKQYPDAPLFKYAPFNTALFQQFAAASVQRINKIESEANLALKNLPQNLVRGFQGALAGVSLAHRAERDETRAYIERLESQIQILTQQFMQQSLGKGKGSRKTMKIPVLIPPVLSIPTPSLTTAAASSSALMLDSNSCLPSPAADFSFMGDSIDFSFMGDPMDVSFPHGSFDDLAIMPASSTSIPLPSTLPRSPPSQDPLSTVSGFASKTSPPTTISSSFLDPPITTTSGHTATQISAWNTLAIKYSDQRLRRHQWDWVEKTNSFLPRYTFQRVLKITDIWTEWIEGIGGFLSIRDLNNTWAARWRTGTQTLKNEYGRRKKVIDLINRLAEKPNWNVELALRFIREVYEQDTKTFPTIDHVLSSDETFLF
ncbi:hypothetical protein R3P38DRAFT_923774 [Favolaschia claudopus]|uniref:Transcription activator GCR1-like domain-containing protein n=1 Tax=Favolaschia claudopus TaxID=2862362 RepID=A0AAW0BRR8_9AGAR